MSSQDVATILILEEWLNKCGWTLKKSWSDVDHVDLTARCVVISLRRTQQSQIFGILHEIGHIVLNASPDYAVRFSEANEFKHRKERPHESLRVRTAVLGEEWEAWTIGENIAREMNLSIDYKAFRDSRNLDLKSYASWDVNG
jgi:hypothetical protein